MGSLRLVSTELLHQHATFLAVVSLEGIITFTGASTAAFAMLWTLRYTMLYSRVRSSYNSRGASTCGSKGNCIVTGLVMVRIDEHIVRTHAGFWDHTVIILTFLRKGNEVIRRFVGRVAIGNKSTTVIYNLSLSAVQLTARSIHLHCHLYRCSAQWFHCTDGPPWWDNNLHDSSSHDCHKEHLCVNGYPLWFTESAGPGDSSMG